MIDLNKTKTVYTLIFEDIYNDFDTYSSLRIPVGVKQTIVKEVHKDFITNSDDEYFPIREVFSSKEDAESFVKKEVNNMWNKFNLNIKINKLLKIKEQFKL